MINSNTAGKGVLMATRAINKINRLFRPQLAIDLALVSMIWGTVVMASRITIRPVEQSLSFAVAAIAATMWMFRRKGLYSTAPALPRTEEIARVFIGVLTGAAAVTIFASFSDWPLGAAEILIASVTLFALRMLTKGLINSLSSEFAPKLSSQRVVIVGAGIEAQEIVQLISDHPEIKLNFCGIIGNLAVAEQHGLADQWIGPTDRMIDILERCEIDSAIITTTGFRGERFKQLSQELFSAGYDVHLTTGVGRLWEGRFEFKSLVHEPFISIGRNQPPSWQVRAKRALDVIGAVSALLLASPVLLAAALAIYASDRGPVLYSSRRIGMDSQEFKMYKFRSMVMNAEALKEDMEGDNERSGPLFKVSHDPRITKVGRFLRETSIDELPQLINVLLGDMSLVGPRPALPEETLAFDAELQRRTEVRPGITGLWQVEARSNASFNAYRRLDLHYVENWNFWLDIRILLATAEQVGVSLAMIPFKRVFGTKVSNDSIDATQRSHIELVEPFTFEDVIDLTTKDSSDASDPDAVSPTTR